MTKLTLILAFLCLSCLAAEYKVFFGGLNQVSTMNGLKNEMYSKGCRSDQIADATLVTDKSSHKHRGFGFVTLVNDRTVALDCFSRIREGFVLDGKVIDVKWAIPRDFNFPSAHSRTTTLLVSGGRQKDEALIQKAIKDETIFEPITVTCPGSAGCFAKMANHDEADFVQIHFPVLGVKLGNGDKIRVAKLEPTEPVQRPRNGGRGKAPVNRGRGGFIPTSQGMGTNDYSQGHAAGYGYSQGYGASNQGYDQGYGGYPTARGFAGNRYVPYTEREISHLGVPQGYGGYLKFLTIHNGKLQIQSPTGRGPPSRGYRGPPSRGYRGPRRDTEREIALAKLLEKLDKYLEEEDF